MEYDPVTDEYSIGLEFQTRSWSSLGANFMEGHDILFDVESGRIGVAESDCDYGSPVDITPKKDGGIQSPVNLEEKTEEVVVASWPTVNETKLLGQSDGGVSPQRGPKSTVEDFQGDSVCSLARCGIAISLIAIITVAAIMVTFVRRYYCTSSQHGSFESVPLKNEDEHDF